jgi:hypothetical protein
MTVDAPAVSSMVPGITETGSLFERSFFDLLNRNNCLVFQRGKALEFNRSWCNREMKVHDLTNRGLRLALRKNQVSFPSQIPVFERQSRCDIQWRAVQLYFVRGWSIDKLGKRYNLTSQRIMQILKMWRMRAVALGYVQEIPANDPIEAFRDQRDEVLELQPIPPLTRAHALDSQPGLQANSSI